ncbi:cob(I)yrinic acid a,c-diamide adenosyltransferase [Enterocloster alcoholdehydrogenati]|uniref:Cob(I)yrinic acid a,c-diamide adenosyltransferase n=2 Tax=Enterocloster alcoholdehydrogenati TaxID=2547410 RepID=A0ABQ0AWP8_9FIRM
MKDSMIQVICGPGKGKTASALGRGVSALIRGKNVIMVQFLKGSMDSDNMEVLKRLEPEFKLFRFEKSPMVFDRLSDEEKEEARINIRNGLNFSKKFLVTGECDILILDEILGILDEGIITLEELCALITQARQSEAELIMTGTVYPAALDEWVDEVTKLQTRFE